MKKALMILVMALMVNLVSSATDFKTFENETFTISYPADWEETYSSDGCLNVASEDSEICFDVTFNERGPMNGRRCRRACPAGQAPQASAARCITLNHSF